eukprot:3760350-Amphidinium_carterae.1
MKDSTSGNTTKQARVQLVVPFDPRKGRDEKSYYIELSFSISIQDQPLQPKLPLSPEIAGGGSALALYSSHRGGWYDADLGPKKFRVEKVASFVEMSFNELTFPEADKGDGKLYKYYVQASCNGVSTTTPALHRAKDDWLKVLDKLSPQKLDFKGCKVSIPLPPSVWSGDSQPLLEVA